MIILWKHYDGGTRSDGYYYYYAENKLYRIQCIQMMPFFFF